MDRIRPVAKAVFAQVDEALSQKLSTLMWDGPMDDLTLTANTQPALMAVSMAVVEVLRNDFDIDVTGRYGGAFRRIA